MHVINPFVFVLDIYNIYLRGKAFISWECRILGSKLYSSLLFLQNNPLGFGLAGFYFFSKSILFYIDLCSTDLSLRKLWAPLQWPFNLKLPGSQSPWELQNIFFSIWLFLQLSCFLLELFSSLQIQAPAIPCGSWRWWWWGSVLLALLLWDWDKYSKTRNRNLLFGVQPGNNNQRQEVCWKTWSSFIYRAVKS